jgi:hypothetical protein
MSQSPTPLALYEGLSAGTQWLFLTYTVLTALAISLYGAAFLQTRVLPSWVGWLAIVYGIGELTMLLLTGDVAPLLHYAMPFLFGILLLLRRSKVPTRVPGEERPNSVPATAS